MNLTQQLCEELGLTYWQLKSDDDVKGEAYQLNYQEKELLGKILLAKGITLTDEIFTVQDKGIVEVKLSEYTLIFDNADKPNQGNIIYLSKLSAMLESQHEKKLTWYKLKQI